MKLGVMQPYFFPYLGYWQLINAVDRFVVYDDVNFMKGGWVNRNRILVNGEPVFITVPLRNASPNRRICDIEVHEGAFRRDRLLKTISQAYRRAPHFEQVYPVIEKIVRNPERNLANYLDGSIRRICDLLGIQAKIVRSSEAYDNQDMKGQARILDICKREGANTYINAQGGSKLYDTHAFSEVGVELRFLKMCPVAYVDRRKHPDSYLSVVNLLMELGVEGVRLHLRDYDLISGEKTDEY